VAARSYAWAENRKPPLYKTCDTTACQVYGGAGLNGVRIEDTRSDAAVAATAGEVRIKAGEVARTEFSSSTGGWTAGGTFTAVEDTGDDVSSNPNHNWEVDVPVATIETAFPEIGTLKSIVVTKRNGLGADGGRVTEVKLRGSTASATVTGNDVRSKLGLKSDWFSIVAEQVGVARLSGEDRYRTAIAVSADAFPAGTADAAVLASSANYPDALVGVPLAKAKHGPILLSGADAIGPLTQDELKRATGGDGTVYLLGGTVALSDNVANQLTTAGYTVKRIGGANRFETAVLVARELNDPDTLLEATGTTFVDALAAGAAAAKADGAILLTDGSRQAPQTAAYLASRTTAKRYAVGGSAVAADRTATPLAGSDRYATATIVAGNFFPDAELAGLASGGNYPDALSGGLHAVLKGGPLLLTDSKALAAATGDYLRNDAGNITSVFVYGGPSAVADTVLDEVKKT
jgi:SpoIID/LytB domain protein